MHGASPRFSKTRRCSTRTLTFRDAGGAIRRHRFPSRFYAGGTTATQTAGVNWNHITCAFKDLFDLKGRTAVVTGGCGILGRRFTEGLAEFGAKVAIIDLDQQAVQAAASELSRALRHRRKGLRLRHHAAGNDTPGCCCHRSGPRTGFHPAQQRGKQDPRCRRVLCSCRDILRGNLARDHVRQSRRHVQRRPGFWNN